MQYPDVTKTVEEARWVRVMADYLSTGLWGPSGASVEVERVPMSDALKARLAEWCDWYEFNEDYLPAEARKHAFDHEKFSAAGLELAKAIKAELPDWTIVYFDEFKMMNTKSRADRSQYEYEVTV